MNNNADDEIPSQVRANVSSNHTPVFNVPAIDTRSSYAIVIYAVNARGRSEPVTLYTVALRSPDKYIGKSYYFDIKVGFATMER
jgi:hypothetical protein